MEDANYLFVKSHISINDKTRIMITIPYHDHHLIVDPPDHNIFVFITYPLVLVFLGIRLTNIIFGSTVYRHLSTSLLTYS